MVRNKKILLTTFMLICLTFITTACSSGEKDTETISDSDIEQVEAEIQEQFVPAIQNLIEDYKTGDNLGEDFPENLDYPIINSYHDFASAIFEEDLGVYRVIINLTENGEQALLVHMAPVESRIEHMNEPYSVVGTGFLEIDGEIENPENPTVDIPATENND